ncbi:MAG: hypothetical protein ACTSUD_00720 [Alphaproteobacteria bacterium]
MRYSKALLLAGAIAASAVLLAGRAETQSLSSRYQLAATANGAWRLDTVTGRMIWCSSRPVKLKEAAKVFRSSQTKTIVTCYDRNGQLDRSRY